MEITIGNRVSAVKVLLDKIERIRGETAHYEIEAGQHLIILKEEAKEKRIKWDDYVHDKFDIRKSYANDLIRVAKKLDTNDERKAKATKRKKKQRKNDRDVTASACDVDPTEPQEDEAEEVTRRRVFLVRAKQSVEHAEKNGFDKASNLEIDDEIITAARDAADSWFKVLESLQRRTRTIRRLHHG
jgi:hypothetical protein